MQASEHGVKNAGAAFCVSCRHLSTVSKMLVMRSVCVMQASKRGVMSCRHWSMVPSKLCFTFEPKLLCKGA